MYMTLDQWMRERGVTDQALAEKVNVSRPYLTRIRRGERQPSLRVAMRLVYETGLPTSAFLVGETA